MILLNGHTLAPKTRFTPETMPLTLTDAGVSTASITVGPEAPEIKIDDWLKDDTEPGKGIVWRVKGVDTAFETNTRTIQLEHVIATLKDALLFGEISTKTLGGGSTVSAKKAAQYVLGKQSIWTLGDFEFSRSLPYTFSNVTVFAALETICGTLTDWRWEYDLTALPFKLHIRKISTAVGCEMRSGRNLLTLRRTVDRSGMYTRFYPVGARNMHISGNYLSRNENLYGVVCRTETDQSITKKELLKAWAEDKLARHAEPLVTVTISGLELSQATGEPLDHIRLGLTCRVPLPEYGTTILERVTRLNWSDKLREPERVTVTLANQLNDVANIIRQLSSSGSRNSAGGAAAQEEDHAWIVDTADHVGMVAEAVAGEGAAEDWSRVSSIMVDGQGIHQRVTKTENDLVVAETRIDMNEQAITLEATRATEAEGSLSGRITVEAGRITTEVTRAKGAESTLSGRITVEAERITTEVTRATEAEDTLSGRITVEAGRITSEVTRATAAENSLSSRITQTDESITAEVTRAGAAEASLSGRITVNSDKVSLVVKETSGGGYVVDSAEIVAGINGQTGSYVKIKAKTIDLDGYVTASELSATNATIDNLKNGTTQASHLDGSLVTGTTVTARNTLNANTNFNFKNHAISFKTITIDGTTYHLMGYT